MNAEGANTDCYMYHQGLILDSDYIPNYEEEGCKNPSLHGTRMHGTIPVGDCHRRASDMYVEERKKERKKKRC